MNGLTSEPKHPLLKKNIKMMHNDHERKLFDTLMDEIVDAITEMYSHKVFL